MAARYEATEPETDHLQHLALDRVDDTARHSKSALDVDHALVDPTSDEARPTDFGAQPDADDHHRAERDEVHQRSDEHVKQDVLIVGQDPTVEAEHEQPQHRPDTSASDHLAHVHEDPPDQVHPDVVAEDTPHGVLAEHSALVDGHVDAVSLAAGPVSAAHAAHLSVIMPPQSLTHVPTPAAEPQPAKKKRKTYSNEEERRKARILKNRRTAEESRQRRMKKMKELEDYMATSQIREKKTQEESHMLRMQLQSMDQIVNEKNAIIAQKDAEIQRLQEKLHMKQT